MEVSAPQVVVSLPPFEDFTEPVYNQVHQEQIVTGEMTLNIVEHPAVQEQVTVEEILPVVERIQEQIVETIDVTPHASQMVLHTSSTSSNSSAPVCNQIPSLSSASTISDDVAVMLDSLKNIEKEVARAAMLTKRMMETPLPESPLPEPPMVEPPKVVPDRTSAKRRRRTRYTRLPGIMENAVYLAPTVLRHGASKLETSRLTGSA